MDQIVQDAFITTTIESRKNDRLEESIKETENNMKKMRTFANSDNKIVRLIAWFFVIIIIFFIVPLFLTGFLTKGMRKDNQKAIWGTIIIMVVLGLIKNTLF